MGDGQNGVVMIQYKTAFDQCCDPMLVFRHGAVAERNAAAWAIFSGDDVTDTMEEESRRAWESSFHLWSSGEASQASVVLSDERSFDFTGYGTGIDGEVTVLGRETTALLALRAKVEQSREEDEQLAYAASHDLQEPLRTVTNYAGFLLEDFGDVLPDQAKEQLGYVIDAAKHGRALVQGLLQISRVGKVSPAVIDFKDVVERAVLNLEFGIRSSNATVSHQELPQVYADFQACVTVLQNLIANSIKFVVSGDQPAVSVTAIQVNDEWEISVLDNGIGIAPRHATAVFQIFRRLDTARPGTGVGLATCKKIVEAHGGRIWVAPSGAGTLIRFTLPVVPDEKHIASRGQSTGCQSGDTVPIRSGEAVQYPRRDKRLRGTSFLASSGSLRDRPAPRPRHYGPQHAGAYRLRPARVAQGQ